MDFSILHCFQFDERLNTPEKRWFVQHLDRLAEDVNFPLFNKYRHEAAVGGASNDGIKAGIAVMGKHIIGGHTHCPEAFTVISTNEGNKGAVLYVWNCGSWIGPHPPHFVKTVINGQIYYLTSDPHLGAPEFRRFMQLFLEFLDFVDEQDAVFILVGDTADYYDCETPEQIVALYGPVVDRLKKVKHLILIGGNHDYDRDLLKKLLDYHADIPWMLNISTDDIPQLIEWKGKN